MSTAVSSVARCDHQQSCLDALVAARLTGQPKSIQRAEQDVIVAFLSMATALARRYRGRGVPADDLEQLARLGLVKATKRWNPEVGDGFVQFAAPTITGEIKRYFRDYNYSIRMPRQLHDLKQEAATAEHALEQELGRPPVDAELAQTLRVEPAMLGQFRLARLATRPYSLDTYGTFASVQNLPDRPAERNFNRVEDQVALQPALAELDDRERRVLELYYYHELSQAKIGELIGLSQMQVSRILGATTQKLRTRMAS